MQTRRAPTATVVPPSDATLLDLDRRHAALWKRAREIGRELDCPDESDEYIASLFAAEAITQSLIALPAKSEAARLAKLRIVRREYPGMSAAEILRETERGHGDVVASILDDLLALA